MPAPAISKHELNQFTGTEKYYRHWARRLVYTEGVQFVAEKMGAYWLLDVIASYQPGLQDQEFQVWILEKSGDEYRVVCSDGNDNILITQIIPSTDFHEDLMPFKLFCCNNTILLPSEY